ncbi:hypothetical protein ACJ5H2_15215 [Nocardioides sp. R1-1]|uniref:hypothetical protein n=1 Tax=Nocardioides sp. R1-1 TaxID=3383502 RepID=UPI0038D1270D
MTLHATFRTAAATILVAGAVALLPQGPARAAACGGSTGVSVVVDSNELGAGISSGCDPHVGDDVAAKNFADAGYALEYSKAAGMSGFVCKVNGNPSNGDCTETDSYWSLWWSDGKSGTWTYANRGVASLRIPDGGYVAFSWHKGSGQAAPPDVAPTPRVVEAKPTPTASPTRSTATKKSPAGKKPTPSAPAATSTTTASVTPTATPTPSGTPTPTEAATSTAPTDVPSQTSTTGLPSIDEITEGPEATAADVDAADGDGGFPAWLGVGLVVLVLGAAAAVPVLRRRQG